MSYEEIAVAVFIAMFPGSILLGMLASWLLNVIVRHSA